MEDTDASYTFVPGRLLREMGIWPIDKISMVLADGRTMEYPMGEARAFISGRNIPTLVVFGADDARALLGAYTLGGFAPGG